MGIEDFALFEIAEEFGYLSRLKNRLDLGHKGGDFRRKLRVIEARLKKVEKFFADEVTGGILDAKLFFDAVGRSTLINPDFVKFRHRKIEILCRRLKFKGWLNARSVFALTISVADVLSFFDAESKNHPAVKRWSPITRTKLASSILAALRDFGLLKGIYSKRIQRPAVSPETVFHLLCILLAEGRHGRAVTEAPDWRLFLWSDDDAAKALAELAQRRWIRFERGGRTVILEPIRIPEAGA